MIQIVKARPSVNRMVCRDGSLGLTLLRFPCGHPIFLFYFGPPIVGSPCPAPVMCPGCMVIEP